MNYTEQTNLITTIPEDIITKCRCIEVCFRQEDYSYSIEFADTEIVETRAYIIWLLNNGYITEAQKETALRFFQKTIDNHTFVYTLINMLISEKELRVYIGIPELVGISINSDGVITRHKVYKGMEDGDVSYIDILTGIYKEYTQNTDGKYVFDTNVVMPECMHTNWYQSAYDVNGQYYFRFSNSLTHTENCIRLDKLDIIQGV